MRAGVRQGDWKLVWHTMLPAKAELYDIKNDPSEKNDVAAQHPEYSSAIISGAKVAFLQGDDWAYAAGVIAIVLGAILVFFMFPKHDEEKRLLALYHETDSKGVEAQ